MSMAKPPNHMAKPSHSYSWQNLHMKPSQCFIVVAKPFHKCSLYKILVKTVLFSQNLAKWENSLFLFDVWPIFSFLAYLAHSLLFYSCSLVCVLVLSLLCVCVCLFMHMNTHTKSLSFRASQVHTCYSASHTVTPCDIHTHTHTHSLTSCL